MTDQQGDTIIRLLTELLMKISNPVASVVPASGQISVINKACIEIDEAAANISVMLSDPSDLSREVQHHLKTTHHMLKVIKTRLLLGHEAASKVMRERPDIFMPTATLQEDAEARRRQWCDAALHGTGVRRMSEDGMSHHVPIDVFRASIVCEKCGGDCSDANPPVMDCPMHRYRRWGQRS